MNMARMGNSMLNFYFRQKKNVEDFVGVTFLRATV
jgi:hypothetical protein